MVFSRLGDYYGLLINGTLQVYEFIDTTLEAFYIQTFISLVYPIFIAIVFLPLVVLILLYISALLLHIYCQRENLCTALQESLERRDPWAGGRYFVSLLWDAHGRIWHGYEVNGLEYIPEEGGALLIYYHGALPVDIYYLISRIVVTKGKLIHSVGDRFLEKIPGWRNLLEAFSIHTGTVSSCSEIIKQGNLLTLSPGGVREAQFSDHSYPLMWGTRVGFAKVALSANCPVVPMFTENIREAFGTFCWPQSFWVALYEKLRLPLAPIFGGFPVKLRTHFGPPVYPQAGETAEELAHRIQSSVRNLISRHQKLPGNILRALVARVFDAEFYFSGL